MSPVEWSTAIIADGNISAPGVGSDRAPASSSVFCKALASSVGSIIAPWDCGARRPDRWHAAPGSASASVGVETGLRPLRDHRLHLKNALTPSQIVRASTRSRAALRRGVGWRFATARSSGDCGLIATSNAASDSVSRFRLLAEIGDGRGAHALEISAERRQRQVEVEDLVLRKTRVRVESRAPSAGNLIPATVRAAASCSRATCMEMVEPPETIGHCCTNCQAARPGRAPDRRRRARGRAGLRTPSTRSM